MKGYRRVMHIDEHDLEVLSVNQLFIRCHQFRSEVRVRRAMSLFNKMKGNRVQYSEYAPAIIKMKFVRGRGGRGALDDHSYELHSV